MPAIAIPGQENPAKYINGKPHTNPNSLTELWDETVQNLASPDYIDISVNGWIEDIKPLGPAETKEIWPGGTIRELPLEPVTMFIKSTNAGDLQPLQLTYLDEEKRYRKSIFILQGTTPVELPPIYRILDAENVSGAGTDAYLESFGVTSQVSGPTLGEVSIYSDGGTGDFSDPKTQAGWSNEFTAGGNSTGIAMEKAFLSSTTVPRGYQGYAFHFESSIGKSDEVFFAMQTRTSTGEWVTRIPYVTFQSDIQRDILPRVLLELMDTRILAFEIGSIPLVPVAFSYQVLLLKSQE